MELQKFLKRIQRDPELNPGEKIIVCLDRRCEAMLKDAYFLTSDGKMEKVCTETVTNSKQADEAVIRMSEDGDDLVVFYESRPSSRDHRPNGIRIPKEGLDFPCVAFCNAGEEPVTVEGEWVKPGDYVVIQDPKEGDPEVRKAMKAFMNSPEVLSEVKAAQRAYEEKKRGKEQA